MEGQSVENALQGWVTTIGILVPLITIAGSALAYVLKQFQDRKNSKHERLFELMAHIDAKTPIASKVAAVYQLRQFPEHKEFIIRFCETQQNNIDGNGVASASLIEEMELTAAYMRSHK